MAITTRAYALERLGLLRGSRSIEDTWHGSERIKAYYERHAAKNISGRLAQRHIDAFLGFCSACESSQGSITQFEILQGLDVIAARWPEMPLQSKAQLFSPSELKGIAREASKALFKIHAAETGLSNRCLEKLTQLISCVESQAQGMYMSILEADYLTSADSTLSVSLPVLIGFLESATECPGAFSFSDFILTTRALNVMLPKVCSVSPTSSSASFEDLQQQFDASLNFFIQLQDISSRFVLAWAQFTCAKTFSTTSAEIWQALSDPSVYAPEKDIVDPIVWRTVIEHARLQYDLTNTIALSVSSEAVLGHTLKMFCVSAISLDNYDETLSTWLSNLLLDAGDLDDPVLGPAVLQVLSALAIRFPAHASDSIKMFKDIVQFAPRLQDEDSPSLASLAAKYLLRILEFYSNDGLVSTMYGFANHLNGPSGASEFSSFPTNGLKAGHVNGDEASVLSRNSDNEKTARNVIEAISIFGTNCRDAQLSALALSILIQKSERVHEAVQRKIVTELAAVALHCTDKDISRVSNYYAKLEAQTEDPEMSIAIQYARNEISSHLVDTASTAYDTYLETLLKTGIQRATNSTNPASLTTVLFPLSTLMKGRGAISPRRPSVDLVQLFHDLWFRLVIAGYTINSELVVYNLESLKNVARGSPTLALETLTDSFESDLESYPVLKQAHEHSETLKLQSTLGRYAPGGNSRQLNFPKAVYLNAVALLESLRCQTGIASGSLSYYRLSSLSQSDVQDLLSTVFHHNTRDFIRAVALNSAGIDLDRQLHDLLIGCCDQIGAVRNQAVSVINHIVHNIPSAFCSSLAITTLLESITLLGWARYEEFSDQYSPTYEFKSTRTDLSIIVPDSFADRQQSLDSAQRNARRWLERAMLESASDVRTLLTTYITAAEDHITGAPSDKGKLLAVELAMQSSGRDQPGPNITIKDSADAFLGEITLRHLQAISSPHYPALHTDGEAMERKDEPEISSRTLLERSMHRKVIPFGVLRAKLCSYAARVLESDHDRCRLVRNLVEIPFNLFNIAAMRLATSLWARVVTERPALQADLLAQISTCWLRTIRQRKGMFTLAINIDNPFSRVMEYAPTNKEAIAKDAKSARALLEPHLNVLRFLSSRLATPQSHNITGQKIVLQIVRATMKAMAAGAVSDHMFARDLRLRVLMMGMRMATILKVLRLTAIRRRFSDLLYDAALSTFASSPRWAFGSDVGQMRTDRQQFVTLLEYVESDSIPNSTTLQSKSQLLAYLIETEISRIDLWLSPMARSKPHLVDPRRLQPLLTTAWRSNPSIAISLAQRFPAPSLHAAVRKLILRRPWEALNDAYAAEYVLGHSLPSDASRALKYLLYWAPVVPITATTYFLPAFQSHPLVLQFAMRSLESHPVDVTFFYVPQIVQVLRHDALGYVRRFIVETAKLSQLFAHQIIWNFDANAYKDEDATIPDSIKPTLDSIKARMMANLSGADKLFYETEFRFFGEVTSISGKLKPFIKKTKPEKKAKIDEEMAVIKVEQGVYLPSNPDGEVVDIDRKSGRPLQSHAKAPFMATFRIRKSRQIEAAFEDDLQVEDNKDRQSRRQKLDIYEKNQSAIFKVGDDCRQDVLALQLISTFRSIFNSIGLDLYVFPYRVTATAPGCGVIDVLPNSISRDMLGREAVNGLYDYFLTTFGKPDTVAFQQARMNFVKSLAAYSVITYLLQFKDRHNGNIMYDAEGHVLHIDFGFCFDIAPGGINFESGPFKLTTEMIAVMGGSAHTQSYRIFQELSIKAFLVARQYSEQIIHLVTLMLDSGLPCFKGQTTINNLRNRFHLDVSEPQAAQVMLNLIAQSHQNQRTVAYDVFQKMVCLSVSLYCSLLT